MLFSKKEETYTITEFLAGNHRAIEKSPTKYTIPTFSFLGLDITHQSFWASAGNDALIFVLVLGGIAIFGAVYEKYLASKGQTKEAERLANILGIGFPLFAVLFIYFGFIKTF
ncbi:hypothetical protein [Sutcliffiella cohnii]|uniref:hypothetical protein n=1 Tax=Sutcliffiella cohnii TaxID=33932 RepID=UPI002E228911|nr:hypothetical protein [Sutcliffiella cohnii]